MAPCRWPRTQPLAQRIVRALGFGGRKKKKQKLCRTPTVDFLLYYTVRSFILIVVDDRQSPLFFSLPLKYRQLVAGGSTSAPFVPTAGRRRVSALASG
ncbi:hypothetical protein BDW42DRAFT_126323 [Aspergillus taichungensis]|uniref:Uncharacterized protein n=1 Tax=Aspergillus taichungensis TaxID=482145 RepID=A0A2J5HQX9_9EURO|nr:hypothetical protein BDW42DRAFT_126323 [Aspergillus taichungensis]